MPLTGWAIFEHVKVHYLFSVSVSASCLLLYCGWSKVTSDYRFETSSKNNLQTYIYCERGSCQFRICITRGAYRKGAKFVGFYSPTHPPTHKRTQLYILVQIKPHLLYPTNPEIWDYPMSSQISLKVVAVHQPYSAECSSCL